MSFSSGVKAEICKLPAAKKCCVVAEAYGVLMYCNTFSENEIKIVTGSREFAARLPKLFKKAFSIEFDRTPTEENDGKSIFSITDKAKIRKIFSACGYEAGSMVAHHVNRGAIDEDCCREAFMRGAFLAGGSVTDPEKRYHLELVTDHYNVSRGVYLILLEMGFSPKDTSRGGNYINYFKQSGSIEDFLTTIGAPLSAMEIMSAKVEKDMRNAVNRRVNCDTANADKVVNAAQEQLEAIRLIEREIGIETLSDKLQETAWLRVANPEASLADLAILSDPPVSKSCLSHRLRKLTDMARELPR